MAAEKIAFMYKVFLTRGYTLIKLVKFWPVKTPSPPPMFFKNENHGQNSVYTIRFITVLKGNRQKLHMFCKLFLSWSP